MEKNSVKIQIKALLENVPIVRVAISSFVSNYNVTVDELVEIKTAVSEAVTNSIEHGYENIDKSDKYVVINASIIESEENILKIEIEDTGIGIDDIELATTPAYTSKPELEHAGLRFTIMQTFMDEMIIDSSKDYGTKITLKKKLKKNCSLCLKEKTENILESIKRVSAC